MTQAASLLRDVAARGRRAVGALLCSMLVFVAGGAGAMSVKPCDDPSLFTKTPVNVVILPYTYTSEWFRPPSPALKQLTVLMQQDSLLEMVKYQRIAVVNLVRPEESPACDPDKIWSHIAGPDRDGGAQRGGGVVMLWGRVYEEGADLFLQSYMRFARTETAETFEAAVPVEGGSVRFRGALPAQVLTFPPRRITRQDLSRITQEFDRAAQVRKQPSDDAEVVRTSPDPNKFKPFGYTVAAVKGDWMQVQSLYGGPGGWVRARVDATRWPLRERVPELHFVDAVVGYLQYRVALDSKVFRREPSARWIEFAERSLLQYDQRSPRAEQPLPAALGRAMIGTLHALRGANAVAAQKSALDAFTQAVQLVPYNAGARNLRNAAAAVVCCGGDRRDAGAADALMKDLLDAVLVDTDGGDGAANLASFHRLVDAWPAVNQKIGGEELERQKNVLQQMKPGTYR